MRMSVIWLSKIRNKKKTMKTKVLKYVGTEVNRVSLRETGDQAWSPGESYELPIENKHIISLVAKGILVPSTEKPSDVIDMSHEPTVDPEVEPMVDSKEEKTEEKIDENTEESGAKSSKGSSKNTNKSGK